MSAGLYIGEQIHAALKARGMTRRKLALELGLHNSVVFLWSANKRLVPEARLKALSAVLPGLDVSQAARYCTAHKGCLMPCEACQRTSEAHGRLWQTKARRERHRSEMRGREGSWFAEEDAVIHEHAGRLSAQDITAKVNEVRKQYDLPPRSRHSLRVHAQAQGVFLGIQGDTYSTNQAETLFGVAWNTLKEWRRLGWLNGHAWGAFWVYEMDEMLEFVRTRPWLVDADKMAPGPLRSALELVNRRDPWMRAYEVAPLVPMTDDTLFKYIKQGLIECHQRTGYHSAHMIRASSVHRLRELLAEAEVRRSAGLRKWNAARQREGRAA